MNQPIELIVNHKPRGQKVLTTLLEELSECHSFDISVAFITQSGISCIIEVLTRLERKGIPGRILTSQYLNFTQPHALESLLRFKNIEVKIDVDSHFHSKGYLFYKGDSKYNLLLGSSNMTSSALTTNVELNVGLNALEESDFFLKKYKSDFNEYWDKAISVNTEFIDKYFKIYSSVRFERSKVQGEVLSVAEELSPAYGRVSPNKMQKKALDRIQALRLEGKDRALLISATGTGKTYLSAFDVKRFNPKRILFIVHRRTIALKSLQTFKSLMPERNMELYSGEQRGKADFLFATVQTISKDVVSGKFHPDEFDYLIVDETHRADARTYKLVLDHFSPKFILGMTATPERTDGGDVFKLFDYNIASEIRLHEALEENMLVPFHYFGVSDLEIDGHLIDDHTDFNLLISDERVKHITEKAALYKTDTGQVKGLIFCSRKSEANELADKLNSHNIRAVSLTGESDEKARQFAIEELENGNLDYILSVDIFNEGVDIPSVNQVIMLRPTQSAIVFIQQLGRGLRKSQGKEYLTVIDFIGNYANSYLIPVALYGDSSYNKDNLRKLLVGGSQGLPGSCTIDFDEISQKQIFNSIDQANLSKKRDLKTDYELVQKIIGRKPLMMDFIEHGSRDPYQYVEYSGSLFEFSKSIEIEFGELSPDESELLSSFSKFVNDGKRILDSLIVRILCERSEVSVIDLKTQVESIIKRPVTDKEIDQSIHCVNLHFDIVRHNKQDVSISNKLNVDLFQLREDIICRQTDFVSFISNPVLKEYLADSCNYSIQRFIKAIENSPSEHQGFILYQKYSRRDVLRILGWDKNRNATTIGGYRMSPDRTNCPIFVTYHKAEDIEGSVAYEDEFLSQSRFKWMSRSKRKIDSAELKPIILARTNNLRLPLFVKKDNNEGIDFYYLGDVLPLDGAIEQQYMPSDDGKELPVVKFEFELKPPVEKGLFKYLMG